MRGIDGMKITMGKGFFLLNLSLYAWFQFLFDFGKEVFFENSISFVFHKF